MADKDYTSFIFDAETNGFANCSVLSLSYIICKNDKILHKDTRYYFAKENYNSHAYSVHGLDEDTIKDKRNDSSYPLYFIDDESWLIDIFSHHKINNIVAHNLSFDSKFLPQEIQNKIIDKTYNTFCTMRKNNHLTQGKPPKLSEACKALGISFDDSEAHSSDYDTLKCFEVFIKTS